MINFIVCNNECLVDYLKKNKNKALLLSFRLSFRIGAGGNFLEWPPVCWGGALGKGAGCLLMDTMEFGSITLVVFTTFPWVMPLIRIFWFEEVGTTGRREVRFDTFELLEIPPTTRAAVGWPSEVGTNNNWLTEFWLFCKTK